MNSTPKLTDEALQVYRATGLSPLEVQEHRKKLREALYAAIDELESIALAGMSGCGQESEEGMRDWHARRAWEFIGIAARSLEPARAAMYATKDVK